MAKTTRKPLRRYAGSPDEVVFTDESGAVIPGFVQVSSDGEAVGGNDSGVIIDRIDKFGDAENTTASGDDVWAGLDSDKWIFSGPGTVSCVSSSANDTGTLTLIGYDAAGKVQTEDITMTGLGAVVSAKSYAFCMPRASYSTGAGPAPPPSVRAVNEGDISITRGAEIVAWIGAGQGQTLQAFWMVPSALEDDTVVDSAMLHEWSCAAGRNDEQIADLFVAPAGKSWQLKDRARIDGSAPGGKRWSEPDNPTAGIELEPLSFIVVRATKVTGGTSRLAAGFSVAMFGE